MWLSYENQLTPEAAAEDGERLFNTLSILLQNIVFYHVVYPSSARYFIEREDMIRAETSQGFLQHLLHRLGYHNDFLGLFKVTVTDVYAYITSDFGDRGIDNETRHCISKWSSLAYKLYPTLKGIPTTRAGQSTRRVDINVVTDQVLSLAVSPRFATALRMLELRDIVESSFRVPMELDENGEPEEIVDLQPLEELPPETAEVIRDRMSIAPSDLAFLAGVSHPYVTKLFRAGKLPARKKDRFILIPVETAVAFVISRPVYPEWIKTLADRMKISPLNI